MTIKRCRLMLENHTLSADSITVSPAPLAGYPASNLADPDRTKLCKVSGSSMTITIRLSQTPWVQALVLTGLDYPVTAQARLQGNSEDVWTSPAYDSGLFDAWPQSYVMGAREFGEAGMGGYVAEPYHRPVVVLYIGQLLTYEYYRVTITDSTASTIALGIAALVPMVEMNRNFTDGWSLRPVDTTDIRRATSGQPKTGRPGTRYEVADLDFKNVAHYEALEMHSHLKSLGQGQYFFIAMHPEDPSGLEPFTTLYGRAAAYSGLRVPGANRADFKLTFEETP